MYTLTEVSKIYRKGSQAIAALKDVSLSIDDGEWVAVQGRTGSGKTTLLQVLGCLDQPTAGIVQMAGRDLARLPEDQLTDVRAVSIGFVFQTFNLIATLTAVENVETALVPRGMAAAERRSRAMEALVDVGLGDRAQHLPSELSGGQQQRVGIARALVKRPKVLLADEPTGNLDVDTRDEILALLENAWRGRGLTVVLVTHDSFVAARAGRIVTMRDGQLVPGKDADDDAR
jgi:putative ABC transport system ATP-binding protein